MDALRAERAVRSAASDISGPTAAWGRAWGKRRTGVVRRALRIVLLSPWAPESGTGLENEILCQTVPLASV